MRNRFISTEAKKDDFYKNIRIYADQGLHVQVMEAVSKYVPKGSSILDVGAGEGAFSLRLKDSGYRVTALDVEEEKWKAKEVEFQKLDLNKGLTKSINKKFDSVCCLEVIEHVENPWALLREIHEIINDNGFLVLSTPNITSFWSRLFFLRTGYFHQFMPQDLQYGHINPMSFHEVINVAKNTGWNVLDIQEGGYLPVFDFSQAKPKVLISNIFRWLFYLISKNYKRGWCLIYVLQKQ